MCEPSHPPAFNSQRRRSLMCTIVMGEMEERNEGRDEGENKLWLRWPPADSTLDTTTLNSANMLGSSGHSHCSDKSLRTQIISVCKDSSFHCHPMLHRPVGKRMWISSRRAFQQAPPWRSTDDEQLAASRSLTEKHWARASRLHSAQSLTEETIPSHELLCVLSQELSITACLRKH